MVIRVRTSEEKRKLFADFSPIENTWVVSDLQSKWHLQEGLLNKHQVLEERAVLRATELWKQFAFQLIPEARVVSPELAQTLFWNWIEPMNLPWARSSQTIPVLLNQMQMWMSIFSNPDHEEIMAEWFQDNPESFVRWGHWFELCAEIWKKCLEQNLVMVSWLPALILGQDLSRLKWSRSLTFDLGPQISQVEALLLKELSQHFEVRVIFPEAPWVSLTRNALRPYADLMSENYQGDPEWQPQVDQSFEFGRFSTQLAEVKDAVANVRNWLDAGVKPKQIALIAPDIEHYWPVLQLYLEQEGIPVQKATTARLGSFSEMAQWMATLRTVTHKVSASDLEVHFFTQQDQPRLAFDNFRVLFSQVYDAMDLGRAKTLFESNSTLDSNVPITMQDFLPWTFRYWQASAGVDHLAILLQYIGQEVPRDLTLKPSQWLSYVEGLLARREITLKPSDDSGVWCVSVSSADWLEATHAVFLNLSEGSLRRIENSPVRPGEAQKIFTDTGFAIGTTDRQELEFEFLWFLNRHWQDLRLNFAGTDFQGGVQTPSRLWMWAGFTNDKLKTLPQMPSPTRWDEIQHQSFSNLVSLRQFSEVRAKGLEQGLSRDFDGQLSTWKPSQEVRVSASSLERFWDCPFIFAAQRKLKLSDDPVLDLDLDRRTRGNLLHALVEELLSEKPRWDWTDAELADLVSHVREKQEIQIGDERMWAPILAQHVRLGRLFLEFEKKWRSTFPMTETVGREIGFECYWDLETAGPSKNKSGITLAGRLDRVDRDSKGRYALIDYKASSGQSTNWSSWMAKHQIQLLLYSQLLEMGLVDIGAGRVVAANYFVVKDSDRRKGFHVPESDSELYSSEDKHRNFITEDQKAEVFAALRVEIQSALKEILEGHLNPNPRELSLCPTCSWRTLCRAPHLN